MRDPRHDHLARILVRHSTRIQPGEVCVVEGIGLETYTLLRAIAHAVLEAGGVPLLKLGDTDATRRLILEANENQLRRLGAILLAEMKQAQAYIGVRGAANAFELADVPRERLDAYNRLIQRPVHLEQRVKHTRWCVLRYPNAAMAQLAGGSTEAFEDFYFRVCTLDYARMAEAVKPLAIRMNRADRVRITGPETDLTFSIRGIGAEACTGEKNIPDGECFTAPVRDSIEGTVRFNTPTIYEGRAFDHIRLRFEKGRVVECDCAGGPVEELRAILDRDEGARYTGEWSIAFHPFVEKPMRDILFDEKIRGSWHLALGNAYDETSNGNQSALHWDLVQIQRPEYGGGTIELDGEVIRRDGVFVTPDLEGLNPERLGVPAS